MQRGNEPFAAVRQLLALKRHEAPPPGFFDRLPGQIHLAIVTAEAEPPGTWLDRWRAAFHWRPALAGAFAVLAVSSVVWRASQSQPPHGISSALLADGQTRITLPRELNPWTAPLRAETVRFVGTVEPTERLSVHPVAAASGPPRDLFRPQLGSPLRASSRWSRLSDVAVTNVTWR